MNSFVIFARRALFALFVALAVPLVAGSASLLVADSASAAVVSSIQVKGNQRIDADTIRAYVLVKPGKAYSAGDIDASIKALFDTGLFADVSIAARGAVLVVTVSENPIINSVNFKGNKKVKAEVLEQVTLLKPRAGLSDARLQSDVNRIKDYYTRSGRNEANVEAKLEQLPNNRVNVIFVITEGARTGVGSIIFVGNKAFTASRLTGIIQTRTTNWLSWLNKRDVYSEEKLQADQELLRRFYLQHGYADFQVLGADAQFDAARGRYVVTFTVDEGPKYKFGDVTVDSSINGVTGDSLKSFVRTRSGRVFNATEIEKSTEALTIELSRLGYVFAQVRPRGDRDYTNNVIAMTYVIDEGPRAYVERIDIRGNTKTRDYVIRREFDISEGDAYNRVMVDRAERRLRALGYFKTVQISTEPGSAPDKVVLVVDVEDQSTGSFSVSVGVSTTDGLIGEVALEESNFLGRGQAVRVSVGGSAGSRTYSLSFTDPYFLGTRVSAGFDLYRNEQKADDNRPYATTSTGGGLRVGLPLTDDLGLQLNYKIANDTISGAAACDPAGTGTVAECFFPNGTRLTSSAGYALTYSTIDNRMDPKEGVFLKVAQDFAGIGGDAKYIRTTADARLYSPLLPDSDIIGMLKVTGGNIMGLGAPVATADNFFKGGETIRGFAPLGYGPRETSTGLAIGGKNFVAGTAEVNFPIPFMPPDFGLRGAVFADAGMLFGHDTPAGCTGPCNIVDDNAIRTSVGGSLLWASPFGQIRADFASALTKQSYDRTQFFRIGAGSSF
ncbi:MAG TPA: outer membrane protein assembly factor BamA [Bauldia sp.]|nr:outer membrane protein assembly factor BamA [Bauldia sp.]